ncbi:TrbC/VIRB2 family [Moraxella caprae]|uniref:TrbC/VIRB2 family n=1 Tax=Moraxella caprae TaxID=90240 RepID=A0A378QMQ5_9GAMM|nr:TrbC/VirB2 family protein [Moraxella caprae]STZ01584.1 TrbC/VIRB2 family [Moraxella caprae]
MYFSQNLTQAQLELRNKKILRFMLMATTLTLTAVLFMIPEAHAAGLQKAQTALDKFINDVLPILRLVAIGAFIFAGAGYMMNMVIKPLHQIIVGIIIIGSANELVGLIWG